MSDLSEGRIFLRESGYRQNNQIPEEYEKHPESEETSKDQPYSLVVLTGKEKRRLLIQAFAGKYFQSMVLQRLSGGIGSGKTRDTWLFS